MCFRSGGSGKNVRQILIIWIWFCFAILHLLSRQSRYGMFCWNLIIFRKYCSFPYVVRLGGRLFTICATIQQLVLFLNPFLSSIHLPPKTYFMNVDPTEYMQRIPSRQLKIHYCFWLLMEGTQIVPCSHYDLSFSSSFFSAVGSF